MSSKTDIPKCHSKNDLTLTFLVGGRMYATVQVWRSEDDLRSILSSSSTVGSGHQTHVIGLVGQVPLSAKLSHLSKPL